MSNIATTDSTAAVSFGDKLTNTVLRAVIFLVMRLPWNRRVRTMGAIVRRGIGPLAGYRKRAETNLAQIWPDLAPHDRRRIANGVLDNFGRTLIENYSYQEFGDHLATAQITGAGLAAVEDARSRGRAVLFVTGHFGNHEAPRQVLHALGHSIGGLYRPMSNRAFNDHYAQTMTDLSGPVFEQGRRGTMGFARMLREGGMGTLLFDVSDRSGVPIPFLGRLAWTSTSVADLALKFDALVVPYFGIRQKDGISFEIAIEDPVPHGAPTAMMVELTRRLEARVTANPEQWFWVHRRWKGQPSAKAAYAALEMPD